jgi:hypothetical protein
MSEYRAHQDSSKDEHDQRHGSHSWMMIVCCIPMLVIALALVVTGITSSGVIFGVIGCTVMMALMMRGMDHGGGNHR